VNGGYAGLTDAELMQRLALTQAGSGGPPIAQPSPVTVTPQPPVNPASASDPAYNHGFDPSKMTDADLMAAAANSDPTMSTGEDVGRSAATGLERGAASIPATPGNLHELAGHGTEWLLHHGVGAVQDAMGYKGGNPDFPYMGKDNAHFGEGVPPIDYAHIHGFVSQGDMDKAVQEHAGPYHTPQTTAGRYAERISEFAPAALLPASKAGRLANVLTPAIGSQAAEDMAPAPYKGLAGFAGAVVGGGLNGAVGKAVRAPQASFGAAMGDVSDQQIMQAQALRQQAAAKGLDITLPEAVQQVTNNGTGLGRMQRVIESSKQGQQLTAPYFADRPNQVSAAARHYADTIAPPSTQPGMIGQRAQGAATTALNNARQVVNQAASGDYAALPNQTMEPQAYAELAAQPSYKIALDQLRSHPELGAEVAHLPDNSLAVVNEVKKRLAVMSDQAAGTPLVPGDNHLAGIRIGAKAATDEAARMASPEYAAANDTVRGLSQQYVEPLKAGPLGAISKTDQVGSQTGALYPAQPPEGASNETGQAVRVLGATDPGVAEDLTRQHLINTLNNSMKDLQGGQNQYAGAKYAVALAGHPEQAAALHEGLSALPGGADRAKEMADLLEALRATGKRQQPGSMTAFNESDLKDLHIAPFAHALGRIGDPLTWGTGIGDAINRVNYRRNVKSLADMIMAEPDKTAAVLQAAQAASPKHGSALLPALLQAKGKHK
jgi:hypothetical protein